MLARVFISQWDRSMNIIIQTTAARPRPISRTRPRFVDDDVRNETHDGVIENCTGLFSRGWMLLSRRRNWHSRYKVLYSAIVSHFRKIGTRGERGDIWRRWVFKARYSPVRSKEEERKTEEKKDVGGQASTIQEERRVSLVEIGTSSPRFETAARNELISITRTRFLSERSTGTYVATVVRPYDESSMLPARPSPSRFHAAGAADAPSFADRTRPTSPSTSRRRAAPCRNRRNHSVAIFPRVESERKVRRRRDSPRFFHPSIDARSLTRVYRFSFFTI